mmetsp:Transcript_13418/g.33812  ORF Transcript_13418/g.33812 Transcript_13418/m.33812 type:complete len:248 (+) Transcript_13418:782-1525(+)
MWNHPRGRQTASRPWKWALQRHANQKMALLPPFSRDQAQGSQAALQDPACPATRPQPSWLAGVRSAPSKGQPLSRREAHAAIQQPRCVTTMGPWYMTRTARPLHGNALMYSCPRAHSWLGTSWLLHQCPARSSPCASPTKTTPMITTKDFQRCLALVARSFGLPNSCFQSVWRILALLGLRLMTWTGKCTQGSLLHAKRCPCLLRQHRRPFSAIASGARTVSLSIASQWMARSAPILFLIGIPKEAS